MLVSMKVMRLITLIFQTLKYTVASAFFDLRNIFGRKNEQKTVTILDFFYHIWNTDIAVCLLLYQETDELVVALMTYDDSVLKERLYIKTKFILLMALPFMMHIYQ